MKKIIENRYANLYLNAAIKLGLEYSILNEEIGLVRIYSDKTVLDISSNVLGVNSQLSSNLSVNKVKTSILLKSQNIPTPKFKTFTEEIAANTYAINQLKKKKALVVKPISGSLSIGITVKPSTPAQIRNAVKEAFEGNSSIMIEEYIPGKHFRITILDDEIIAITQRIAANVTGDGKQTVTELIQQKNAQREKMQLPPIFLRKKDLHYLKEENIDLQKIYPKGTYILLQLGCDLDIGGERVRIDKENIPQENRELFINAAKTLSLRFAGIDYITPNITTPHTLIRSAINEINSAPDSDVHYRDTFPHDNYAAERIMKNIFFKNTSGKRKNEAWHLSKSSISFRGIEATL